METPRSARGCEMEQSKESIKDGDMVSLSLNGFMGGIKEYGRYFLAVSIINQLWQ